MQLYVLHILQHPVILGIVFLDSHKVDIDFGKKLVYIKDKLVRTSIKHSDTGLARLCKHTEIPPNSQMNVLVRVSRRKVGDHRVCNHVIAVYSENKLQHYATAYRNHKSADEKLCLVSNLYFSSKPG